MTINDRPEPLVPLAAGHTGSDPRRLSSDGQLLGLRLVVVQDQARKAEDRPIELSGGVSAEGSGVPRERPSEAAQRLATGLAADLRVGGKLSSHQSKSSPLGVWRRLAAAAGPVARGHRLLGGRGSGAGRAWRVGLAAFATRPDAAAKVRESACFFPTDSGRLDR